MSERAALPNRRPATILTIEQGGQRYFVNFGQTWTPGSAERQGFYDLAGPPLEVFIQAEKTSSPVEAVARDAAILISFALQFGISAETLRAAMTREEDGSPSSVIGAALDAMHGAFPPRPPSEPTEGAPTPNPAGGDGAAALTEGA